MEVPGTAEGVKVVICSHNFLDDGMNFFQIKIRVLVVKEGSLFDGIGGLLSRMNLS